MLTLGQEDALRGLFATFRQLPPRPFDTVEPPTSGLPSQPLVVRTRTEEGKTFLYVVNDSPWSVSAEIDLLAAGTVNLRGLGGRAVQSPRPLGTRWIWEVDLEPYDLLGVESDAELTVETCALRSTGTLMPTCAGR